MTSFLKTFLVFSSTTLVLVLTPLHKGYPAEMVTIDAVVTCDLSDNPKTVFNPGDDIRYKVNFTTGNLTFLVLLTGKVEGTTFQETLPWQHGILLPGTYTTGWDSKLPSDANGTVSVCISLIGIIGGVTSEKVTFTIVEGEPPEEPDFVGSNVCKACHLIKFESLKDSSHGFIECEFCHGPGSIHVSSPSPDNIIVDKSSSLCGQCHTRGDDQNRIAAEDGLIKRNQQFDELLNGGMSFLGCVQCHDPHVSLTSDTQDAITTDCSSCHSQTINRIHTTAGLGCTDCHMPYAVKKKTSSGDGDHLKGDGRTHVFTVNSTANPSEMFYQQSGKTFSNGFLTLNFLCLGCHDGNFAKEREFDWAVQGVGLIHSN